MSMTFRTALLFVGAVFSLGALAQPAPGDDPGSYDQSDQADPPSRVARLAYLRGAVSFVPAGENDWVEAQLNRPLISGDKLWTDHGSRAELEIGAAALRIDEETSFDFLDLDDQTAQVELTQGSLNLRVRRLYDNQVYEVDTPTLAFVVDRVGEYRISVQPDGEATIVSVMRGGGDVYGEGGARYRVEEGQSVTFNDSQLRDFYTDALPRPDDFDAFIAERDGRWDRSRSREYVAEDVIGYEDLDDNGEWSDVPEYGHVWYPTTVSVGWTPYHYGHWGWVGAYGWTWIDDAPWGFAPFHYGRWAHIGNRWGWCPGPRSVRPYYAPALVAFIGGGVTISVGGPVGWFPLGPRDVYFPGYHVSRGYFTRVNVSNTIVNTTIINNYYGGYSRGSINYAEVNFRNRAVAGAVIAVPGAAFVGARPVNRAAISVGRDTFANARVTAFAPVAPTRASLVASTARPGRAPPARALDRRIVAATKPPPPVAPFAAREAVLRKNPGRPLTTREIRSLPAEQAGAGNAQAQRRANVKVVTNAGVPARTPAAPLAKRGEGNRGAAERGNADNARRAAAGTTQERPGRNPGGPDADKARAAPRGNAPEQRLRSSDFVRGNRGNPAQDNADNGNARGARGNAAAQDARSTRASPAAEPPGRNARANPSESRPERQPADQGSNADRGQQRAAQAREQQAERQAQQRAQGQERAQQQRPEQAETQQQRRAQQQEEQQRERSQQAEAQQQRAQQQRSQQAEAQQQRAQQQRAQQAEAQQQRMQQQRAQQAEAQQERMQQQRAQQAEAQQQRMQQQRAQQAEAQQQRAQQQRAQQPQQRNAPPQDRGNNERRGKKRDKDDDDDGGGR